MKRLLRSRKENVIAGVCGGLGKYFDNDPLIFRILFLILFFVGGGGVIIYIIMWIAVPQEKFDPPSPPLNDASDSFANNSTNVDDEVNDKTWFEGKEKPFNDQSEGNILVGLLLTGFGVVMLLHNILPFFRIGKFWPVILIAVGIGLMIGRRKNGVGEDGFKVINKQTEQ